MKKHDKTISIVMPALNEAENISSAVADTLAALDEQSVDGELIVINDGSGDDTGKIVEEMKKSDDRISIIHHDSPMGIGRSFWDGVLAAKMEIVVMYPGDNEMLPGEMLFYLDEMENVDIVVPFIVNESVRSGIRRFVSASYGLFIRVCFGLNVHHSNGLVLYRRSILNGITLKNDGYIYQTELLAKTIRKGYLYAEVPYYIRPRAGGKSKSFSMGNIVQVIVRLLSLSREIRKTGRADEIDPSSASARRKQLAEQQSAKHGKAKKL